MRKSLSCPQCCGRNIVEFFPCMIFPGVEFSVPLVNCCSAHYFEQNLTAVAVSRGHICLPISKFSLSINNFVIHPRARQRDDTVDFEILCSFRLVYPFIFGWFLTLLIHRQEQLILSLLILMFVEIDM